MGYLFLAIACSLVIGAIFKVGGTEGIDRPALLTVNYLCAALLALILTGSDTDVLAGTALAPFIVVGIGVGALFIISFALYALATEVAGLALATAVARISVIIPFLASWLVWDESPGRFQVGGLLCAGAALVLLSAAKEENKIKIVARTAGMRPSGSLMLLGLFVAGGATDTSLKLFEESFAGSYTRSDFILVVFATAALCGCVLLVLRRRPAADVFAGRTIPLGIALGLANYGSVEFFLQALAQLPGTIAFPVNHVAVVVGGTVLGTTVWKESIGRRRWVGLCLAAGALALLSA